MGNLKYFKMITLSTLAAVSFISCQSSDSTDVKETRLTYQYTVNGCATGKKTFSDLSMYCATLIDNQQNNYCAENERLLLYREKCGSDKFENRKFESEKHPSDVASRTEDEINKFPERQSDLSKNSPKTSSEEMIKKLVLVAHPDLPLMVESKASAEVFLTSLSGALIIDSMEPKFEKELKLMQAEVTTLLSTGLDKCPLPIVNLFSWPLPKEPIQFSIIGTDRKHQMESSGCMGRLSAMAMAGFTVEFKNVPVGGVLSNQIIPSVTLKVEIKQNSASDITKEN